MGLIVVIFLLIDLDLDLFHSSTSTSMNIYVLIAVTLLAVISWLDDLYGLSVILRLFIQVLIIVGVLATDHERVNLFPTFVPWWLCFLFILSLWCGLQIYLTLWMVLTEYPGLRSHFYMSGYRNFSCREWMDFSRSRLCIGDSWGLSGFSLVELATSKSFSRGRG